MKLFFSSILLLSAANVVVDAGVPTCVDQQPCLDYTITEIATDDGCYPGECEYKVCWKQIVPTDNTDACTKTDSFR